ncbi:MAG: CDP-diacylglycerol--serine O-phosphatidyltransferase [Bacteroidota bacterium]
MKKHLPNLFTCLNLVTGSIGVYFVLLKSTPEAIYFVIIGAFFDLFDGFLARLLNVSSEVGKQLDSLADLITFGLLPAFYFVSLLEPKTRFFWLGLLIAIFSALRLAIFNVDESQSDSFRGLPTPANAIMLTSLTFIPFYLNTAVLISIIILSCTLLIANFRLMSFKFKTFKWKSNETRWILIISVVPFLIIFQQTFLPFLIPIYISASVIDSIKDKKHNFRKT